MKTWISCFLLFCLLPLIFYPAHASKKNRTLKKRIQIVYLGSTPVKLIQYKKRRGKNFIHVHENECTARQAALAYIKRRGGTLLTLKHRNERNITFVLRHQIYTFDPNRIFTRAGIKASLKLHAHYSPAAAYEVKKLARAILRRLPQGKIIAVHNNKDYSMLSYLKGQNLSQDARAIHKSRHKGYRNFYFVTRYSTYRRLSRRGYNVVLQARHPQNDGSLSVLMAKRDYINVEADYCAYKQQLRMLRAA